MTAPVLTPTIGDPRSAAVAAVYLGSAAALRARLLGFVTAAFAGQGDYRDASAAAFVASVVPMVLAAQHTMVPLTDAYLAHFIATSMNTVAVPVGVAANSVSGVAARGVDPTEVYRRPYTQVWTDLSRGKTLDQAVAAGQRRAVTIAATDLQLARTRTAQQVLQQSTKHVIGYRRELGPGTHHCAMCLLTSSRIYHKADLMPIHPGCVPAGTRVSASGVEALTRRFYTGELTVITTTSGDEVAVTANHPVLTDQGWVPGYLLREGDNIIRDLGSHRTVDGRPDERQSPTLVEDVWRSVSVAGFVRVPLASEDFHGDGSDGEVDVIWPDSNFPAVGDVTFSEPRSERSLVDGEFWWPPLARSGILAALLHGRFSTPGSGVRGSGLARPLFRSHQLPAQRLGGARSSWCDVTALEYEPDRGSRGTVFSGQRVFGNSRDVLSRNFVGREGSPCVTAVRRFDPPALEFTEQGRSAYSSIGLDLLERLAGRVQLDRVVHARRIGFTGHVYNLHTSEGWYRANSHIVSNCSCTPVPVFRGEEVPEVDPALLHDTVRRDLGDKYVQASGKGAINYRDIIITHDHGELGPVLAVRGQDFTGPSDIPGG